jgi:hypothetical protein
VPRPTRRSPPTAFTRGLANQATKLHMALAEQYAPPAAIGDRDLAACEAVIRPRLLAFDYVGVWFERRLRPAKPGPPRQLPLCGPPPTEACVEPWSRPDRGVLRRSRRRSRSP